MTTTADRSPLELLRDHARLQGAEHLLDPARLSALLGRDVELQRVRIKPGASVLVSYRAEAPAPDGAPGTAVSAPDAPGRSAAAAGSPGTAAADVGWALLVLARDKRDNVLRRAARVGTEVREHPLPSAAADGAGAFLLSGGPGSDPRLGSEIERVRRRQGSGDAPRVLSYNPGRHAVLLLPGTGEVLRVAARSLDPLLQVTTQWRELDLPTLDQRRWRGRAAVLVGRQWGDGDLAALASHPQSMSAAARLGGTIARLHTADVSGRDLPEARIGSLIPATSGAVCDLLPHRAAHIERLSARLRGVLRDGEPHVLIHGDLSPDQVLVSVDETAVPGEGRLPLRVVDLDRSGPGPAGVDLGSWIASCLLAGVEEQAAAFLGGYARHRHLPSAEELAAWTARGLLAAALDPMRRYREDWLPAVEQRLVLAETVLDRPERLPLPATDRAPEDAPVPEASSPVPARVLHEGRALNVRRAWADDGRGLPLELTDDTPGTDGAVLRAARLDAATGRVTVHEAGTDPRLPGLARVLAEHSGAVVVSHRPGKRAVVRTRDDDGTTRYVKIVRPGRSRRLLEAIDRAADFTGPFRTAQVLAADEDTVTFAALPGRLLHDGLPVTDGTWRRAWRETLDAWTTAVEASRRRFQDGASSSVGATGATGEGAAGTGIGHVARGAAVHGPQAESEVLAAWCERAAAVDPAGAPTRARAVAAARRDLARLGDPADPALVHRDLHDKQVLWQPDAPPGLLDVDTATLGDPALDVANLRAHATWRELQGLWSAEQSAVVREEIDRTALRLGIPPDALAAYESGTTARLACVYAFRPRWRTAARTLATTLEPSARAHPAAPAAPATPAGPTPSPTPASADPTTPSAGRTTPRDGSTVPLERSMSR